MKTEIMLNGKLSTHHDITGLNLDPELDRLAMDYQDYRIDFRHYRPGDDLTFEDYLIHIGYLPERG